jgi:hypothetical protein
MMVCHFDVTVKGKRIKQYHLQRKTEEGDLTPWPEGGLSSRLELCTLLQQQMWSTPEALVKDFSVNPPFECHEVISRLLKGAVGRYSHPPLH